MAYNPLPGEATQEGPGEPFAPDTAPASTQPSAGSPFEGDAFTRGPAGPAGPQGPQGPAGAQGNPGADGMNGAPGRGIASISATPSVPAPGEDITVVIAYSDGSPQDTFEVPGGEIGADGREIDSVVINADGTLTFNFNRGNPFTTTGNLRGEQGVAGDTFIPVYFVRGLTSDPLTWGATLTLYPDGSTDDQGDPLPDLMDFAYVPLTDNQVFPDGTIGSFNAQNFRAEVQNGNRGFHELGGDGPPGLPGERPVIGTPVAHELASNDNPEVNITGTGAAADPYIFDFGIPPGDTGETGENGVTFASLYLTVGINNLGEPTFTNAGTILLDVHTHILYFRSNDTLVFPNGYDVNTDTQQYTLGDTNIRNLIQSRGLAPHLLGTTGRQGETGPQGPQGNSVGSVTVTEDSSTPTGNIYDVSVGIVDVNGNPVTTLNAGSFTAPRGPAGEIANEIGGRAWSTTTTYASGDIVSHIGRVYQAIVATPTDGVSPNTVQDPPQWKLLIDNTVIDADVENNLTNQTTAPSRIAVENMRATLQTNIDNATGTTYTQSDGITVDNDADTIAVRLSEDADGDNDSGLSFNADGQLQADPAVVLRGLSTSDTVLFASPSGGIIQINDGRDISATVGSDSVLISSNVAQPWDGDNIYLEGAIVSAGVADNLQLFRSLRNR